MARLTGTGSGLRLLALAALLVPARIAAAQDAAPTPAAASPTSDQPAFTEGQLDQMLAPLALYPDDLLSQILMASTYPLEIVQADRWAKAHADLKGDDAAKALEAEDWDASVKSLVAVPDVLGMLSEKLDWTQQLGDAFIAQQDDVLATVQRLRAKAKDAGQLESSKDQTVEVNQDGSTQTIVIESADPQVVYVPVYDTTVVYGPWMYPSYPPYPYYPPAWRTGAAVAVGFAWGYAWGHCDWHGGDVDIDINRNTNINTAIDRNRYVKQTDLSGGRGSWKHDATHRGSVPYRDAGTATRFGGESAAQATAARDSFRGRTASAEPRVIRGGDEGRADSGLDRGAAASGSSGGRGPDRLSSRAEDTQRNAGTRGGAFDGADRRGSDVRRESSRGQSSRSMSRGSGGGSRGGGRGGGRGRGGRR